VACTILAEFHRGALARRRQGESYAQALWILTFRNTRRYGGYVVHMGMVFLFVGFAGSGFNREVQKEMVKGDKVEIGGYTLKLQDLKETENANYISEVGIVKVYRDGKEIKTLKPERRFYRSSEQATTEVALRSTLKEDLYVVLGFNQDGSRAIIHAFLNPLVAWIWLGTFVFMVGTLICLLPDRHEKTLRKEQEVKLDVKELLIKA
jgi:cytochrome c-type biogenesis protein CcmF